MRNCFQNKNETIWEHCQSVLKHYNELLINFPIRFDKYKNFLLSNQLDIKIITEYISWHDVGKPFCEFDSHFIDHANKSADVYSQISSNELVISLIRNDMLFHTIKPKDVNSLTQDVKWLCTLALTALAAIESNSEMFGGKQSESYKIKISNWERRLKQLFMKFNRS